MSKLREGLPPLPPMLQHLPIDARGYPVPRFVHRDKDGTPDHRIADTAYLGQAVRERLCWVCGAAMTEPFYSFVVGPTGLFTRISPEPPMHAQCASYALRACPYLSRPQAKRRAAGMPEEAVRPAGTMLPGHPSVALQWMCRTYRVEVQRRPDGGAAPLFELGEPLAVLWFCEGRGATADEVGAAIEQALQELDALARPDGPEAVQELAVAVARALRTLERLAPPAAGAPA